MKMHFTTVGRKNSLNQNVNAKILKKHGFNLYLFANINKPVKRPSSADITSRICPAGGHFYQLAGCYCLNLSQLDELAEVVCFSFQRTFKEATKLHITKLGWCWHCTDITVYFNSYLLLLVKGVLFF